MSAVAPGYNTRAISSTNICMAYLCGAGFSAPEPRCLLLYQLQHRWRSPRTPRSIPNTSSNPLEASSGLSDVRPTLYYHCHYIYRLGHTDLVRSAPVQREDYPPATYNCTKHIWHHLPSQRHFLARTGKHQWHYYRHPVSPLFDTRLPRGLAGSARMHEWTFTKVVGEGRVEEGYHGEANAVYCVRRIAGRSEMVGAEVSRIAVCVQHLSVEKGVRKVATEFGAVGCSDPGRR